VYGKSGKQMAIVDGRARKSYKHPKPFEEWDVLLKEHHEGYIDWRNSSVTRNSYRPMLTARRAT
jgi:hypothetical protein